MQRTTGHKCLCPRCCPTLNAELNLSCAQQLIRDIKQSLLSHFHPIWFAQLIGVILSLCTSTNGLTFRRQLTLQCLRKGTHLTLCDLPGSLLCDCLCNERFVPSCAVCVCVVVFVSALGFVSKIRRTRNVH